MILVSSDEEDTMTNHVLDWIQHLDGDVLRVNDNDHIHVVSLDPVHNRFEFHLPHIGIAISSQDIGAYWYRRGSLALFTPIIRHGGDGKMHLALNRLLVAENNALAVAVHDMFREMPSINGFSDHKINKFTTLRKARQCGLDVPATIVTASKDVAVKFTERHGRVIGKAMHVGFHAYLDDGIIAGMTHEVTLADIAERSDPLRVSVSCLQELLDKVVDIRIFFLQGRSYASVIFSQSHTRTSIDFRNYDPDRPNRTPPIEIPGSIAARMQVLMDTLGLTSGAIGGVAAGYGGVSCSGGSAGRPHDFIPSYASLPARNEGTSGGRDQRSVRAGPDIRQTAGGY